MAADETFARFAKHAGIARGYIPVLEKVDDVTDCYDHMVKNTCFCLQNYSIPRETTEKLIDEFENQGTELLKVFMESICARANLEAVHVVLLETPKDDFTAGIASAHSRLQVHDVTQDPLAWTSEFSDSSLEKLDIYACATQGHKQDEKVALVLDGLSELILHRGAVYTCQVINKLTRAKQTNGIDLCHVVGLIHRDLHEEHSMALLRHSVDTVITLASARSRDWSGTCRILHKKLTGKVLKSTEQYKLGEGFVLEQSCTVSDAPPVVTADQDAAPDPAANLTFNLTLSDSEKKARSEMHLPYMMHTQPRKEKNPSDGEGKIFYQPDDADDFDEEDPDDDLDI